MSSRFQPLTFEHQTQSPGCKRIRRCGWTRFWRTRVAGILHLFCRSLTLDSSPPQPYGESRGMTCPQRSTKKSCCLEWTRERRCQEIDTWWDIRQLTAVLRRLGVILAAMVAMLYIVQLGATLTRMNTFDDCCCANTYRLCRWSPFLSAEPTPVSSGGEGLERVL